MADDNANARLEALIQESVDSLFPGVTLTDWIVTAAGVMLDGDRSTTLFFLPRWQQPIYVSRGLAQSGLDHWRMKEA